MSTTYHRAQTGDQNRSSCRAILVHNVFACFPRPVSIFHNHYALGKQLKVDVSVNIANANVFGLSQELGIATGNKYNIALVIFFVPYILFEIPSNILLKKMKPRVWLSICMFGFGLVTMLQGFVQNYSGLLATRFFLGLFESGMFPGAFYLIGMCT